MGKDFSTKHPPTQQWGAGWYPDHDNGGERWWDGQEWDRARWRPGSGDGTDQDSCGPGGCRCGAGESPPSGV